MVTCPSCGRDNPEDARFCSACGTTLGADDAERESRKVVTVLFCDLVGSTSLGESTDPEALRARMRRYFEDLRAILERHGGSVEKFVGDAVMAVFGIPASHEDDALRAVRAAWEMREAVAAHGLEARIGVNSGAVVVGGRGETLVTGDAVNVAARLEQAAAPGTVLIGNETRQLVRDAVEVEAVEPLTLKGKSEPVAAFRLIGVLAGAEPVARHLERPLVGRERERQRLRRDYDDAVADRACRLFTLLGTAGIGKSRLVADFLEHAGQGADVLRGRCLPYGEGITYWPLVEILIAAGVEPEAVIGTSPAETQLSFRRLLEERAAEHPQVVVLDDLQWAESTFLDLVEHVADLSRDAPIFLLVIARTELLDARPGWGGGKLNATSLLLEPLGDSECEELIGNLLADARLDDETRERIVETSEGNPLYVEEMLAMVRERAEGDEIVVPPTIHALLQARLDALDGDERIVIERGAVEGEVFHRGSVAQLAPPPVGPEVESHLSTLVRKELIRPDSATLPDDEAFRFRHLLIRDAAYESLPKATRAALHEQFAGWLEHHDLVEQDEILGYHLEQAHAYRTELDPGDPVLPTLATRAFDHLAAAGRGALVRGDIPAARSLLERAASLYAPEDERRLALAPELAEVYVETNDHVRLAEVFDAARKAADPITRARAAVNRAAWGVAGSGELPRDERDRLREEARSVFEAERHDIGLAEYWRAVAWEAWVACRGADSMHACEQALVHLERANALESRLADSVRFRWRATSMYAPLPVDETLRRVRALAAEDRHPLSLAHARLVEGRLLGMKGDAERARELVGGARQMYVDAGLLLSAGGMAIAESELEYELGDVERAEAIARDGLDLLERIGDSGYYPTVAAMLAQTLLHQGRFDEVREWLDRSRETSAADDVVNFVVCDAVEGVLLAHEGTRAESELLGRRAAELADTTDYVYARPVAHAYFAETLALAGKNDEAREHAATAMEILEHKGNVMLAARFRERLAAVGLDGV
jgi:class 3 adenylate cyclase/tetratricopeptide (TPR) repeat protein